MILGPKVIVIEEDDDFSSLEKKLLPLIKGFRPHYILCPRKRFKELLESSLGKRFIFPMLNVIVDGEKRTIEKNVILYDRRHKIK